MASAAVVALAAVAGAHAPPAHATTIRAGSEAEFAAAVAALRDSGGTVVLRPGAYGTLVVPARSHRLLRIVGSLGASVQRLLLDHTQRVSAGPLTIAPRSRNARLIVHDSRHVVLHDLLVTAEGTRHSATVELPGARGVVIRRSTFTHCGDRSRSWAFCLLARATSHRIVVEDSWFHDCYGCDFIHGRFGTDLTIRRNRFDRALPCSWATERCGHQDLIELFSGTRLTVEGNRFGLYLVGGAQLLLANHVDHVTIANNVFLGRDPRLPFDRARLAIALGGLRRAPRFVTIVNNTILSGAPRRRGYATSISLGWRYQSTPRRARPVIADNVIGLLVSTDRVCKGARATRSNVVLYGRGCSSSDRIARIRFDATGRPLAGSRLLVDQAAGRYATAADVTGRPRTPSWAVPWPLLWSGGRGADIGAYESR